MAKTEIKLSVLITFHNQKDFIIDALESAINQTTNFDYEILVGLDKEDSESEAIINNYINRYPFISLYKTDTSKLNTISIEKASLNRINILSHAKGKYFCLLDGDDFYNDTNRFQILCDYLDKNKNIIGVAHDFDFFNNETKNKTIKPFIYSEEKTITCKNHHKHIFVSCFIFRNIFYNKFPNDFNKSFFNDSTIINYMLKYGNLQYIPQIMLSYRTNIESIFNNKPEYIQKLYQMLAAEINHRTNPIIEKLLCKNNKICLKMLYKIAKKGFETNKEIDLIKTFAQKHNCLLTYNIINYKNLNFKEKVNLFINIKKYCIFHKYTKKYKIKNLYYFNSRSNFGDQLNLYVLQRLMNVNIRNTKAKKVNLIAIGSLLQELKHFKLQKITRKPILIWGTGYIDKPKRKESIKVKLNIVALRGKISQKRLSKVINTPLNDIVLGDPGLLASKLINSQNIEKTHSVGVILHYVDEQAEAIKNLKLKNYKLINIGDNPITVLKEISECEFILSSAMHGLIAADSLNIPNQWIRLSDNLCGGSYKFKDYYSIFDIEHPKPIDLRTTTISESDIETLKNNYIKDKHRYEIIEKVKKDLINTNIK